MVAIQKKPLSLRDRQRQQTLQHLMEVAADLIVANGFSATSIDDLAKAAGTSRATVYSYFGSKDAIVEEITRTLWESADDMYREFGELSEWNKANVLAWLTGSVLPRWLHDRPLHRAARKGGTKALEARYEDYADRYVKSLTKKQALWEERFKSKEIRRRALMIISMLESYMSKLLTFEEEPDKEAVMATLADVILDVLHANN